MGTHDFNHDGKITGFDHFMENELATGSFSKNTGHSSSGRSSYNSPDSDRGSAAGTGGGCLSSLLCLIGVLSAAVIGIVHMLS